MHFSRTELDDLKSGELKLECIDMRLLKQSESEERTFEGAGHIQHREDGKLEFVLYAPNSEISIQDLFGPSVKAGEWIPETEFYELTAFDIKNRSWTAGYILPDFTAHADRPGLVIRGRIYELTHTDESDHLGSPGIWMHFPGDIQIPVNTSTTTTIESLNKSTVNVNRNIWLIEAKPWKIIATKEDSGLEVLVSFADEKADAEFEPQMGSRIEEILWFVLSRTLSWDVLQCQSKSNQEIRVRSRAGIVRTPRVRPPMEIQRLESATVLGKMAALYLRHAVANTEERYHPISNQLYKVIYASSAEAIEQEALAVSVAIEAVVHSEFAEYRKVNPEIVQEIKGALEFFKGWDGSPAIADRIRIAIGNIKGASDRGALRALVPEGIITQDQFDTWEKVRHPAAHRGVFSYTRRELVELCDKLYQLLLFLIFRTIGYEGDFTDHTKPGWPSVRYPLSET